VITAWLTLSAAAKKPPPAPRPPPGPPAPTAPTAPAPASPRWLGPSLAGATAVFTGEKNLGREGATVALEYDLSGLDALDPAGADALFAMLAARPDWRVGVTPGGRVATRRDERGPGVGGWHVGAERCERLAVVEARDPAFAGPRVTTAPAAVGSVKLAAYRPTDGPLGCRHWSTALVVDGARVDVEVFEAGAADARPWTLEALQGLPQLVSYARLDAARLAAEGHTEPPGAPGPARYEPTALPGSLWVERWLNAGAPGRVWLRLLDGAGQPWAEAQVGAQSLQQAGWSRDPAHAFLVGSVLLLPGPVPPGATAEWWFEGADGVRRLAADPIGAAAVRP
jgi:hypothetical protein